MRTLKNTGEKSRVVELQVLFMYVAFSLSDKFVPRFTGGCIGLRGWGN